MPCSITEPRLDVRERRRQHARLRTRLEPVTRSRARDILYWNPFSACIVANADRMASCATCAACSFS